MLEEVILLSSNARKRKRKILVKFCFYQYLANWANSFWESLNRSTRVCSLVEMETEVALKVHITSERCRRGNQVKTNVNQQVCTRKLIINNMLRFYHNHWKEVSRRQFSFSCRTTENAKVSLLRAAPGMPVRTWALLFIQQRILTVFKGFYGVHD